MLNRSLPAAPSPEAAACARRMLDSTPLGHRGTPQDIAYGLDQGVFRTELVVDGGCTTV
ncbi:hypothetical protein [Streptomyces sp. NPDC005969]|uniref:hypothetical protein n=1 Tax=Streptomyces sp. NPDC005969 TaxID=3156722 RepID=UPI00340C6717